MPCYQPLVRIENKNSFKVNKDGKISGVAHIQSYKKLEHIKEKYDDKIVLTIPCGKCIGCRLEYSREWANRAYLESKLYENNYFITLTYADENLPIKEKVKDSKGRVYVRSEDWKGTLVPKHLTDFLKRLRKQIGSFRYIACGEYGEEGERPHYHIILLDAKFPTESFYNSRLINNEFYWENKILQKTWTYGISNITTCTWNTIAYTCRYITKKINGPYSEQWYCSKGQEKEFLRVSRMPGIGKPYYDLHKEEIYKYDEITIKNKEGIVKCKPPKYFDMLYERENEEKMKEIKEKRRKIAYQNNKIKDTKHSNSRWEQYGIEERSKESITHQLRRQFEKN